MPDVYGAFYDLMSMMKSKVMPTFDSLSPSLSDYYFWAGGSILEKGEQLNTTDFTYVGW